MQWLWSPTKSHCPGSIWAEFASSLHFALCILHLLIFPPKIQYRWGADTPPRPLVACAGMKLVQEQTSELRAESTAVSDSDLWCNTSCMKPHLESELILCGPSCLAPSFPHYLQSPALQKPSYCSALKEYFSLSPLDISFLRRQSNYHCNLGGSCRCKMAMLSSLLQTVFAGSVAADERKLINFLECFLAVQLHQ